MKSELQINDTIKVKDGIHTEDFNIDLSGRVGTITGIASDEGETPILYYVEWDSGTLKEFEISSIQYLDEQMYDWDFTLLYESEFTKVSQRYTLAETDKTLNELKDKLKKS